MKVKIIEKFCEISPKLSRNGKVTCHPNEKLGFYENYDTPPLVKKKVILRLTVFFSSAAHLLR
jgi:hypothetical protein